MHCTFHASFSATQNQGQSLVVHTSVPYGLAHLEDDLNIVKDEILGQVFGILPELPAPLSVVAHRWRYSQVHTV